MKTSTLIGLCMALVLLSGTAAAEWNVTWMPIKESIIDKEYIIEVQNMKSTKRNVDITSFFAETSFDISDLSDIEFYEWKDVPYTYIVDHYDEVDHSKFDPGNGTRNHWTEQVYNRTETIESSKLDWKACKSQMFKETGTTKKDDYGFINIPALGSKPKDDGTKNGTKTFKLTFRTPVVYDGSYGSVGKVALLLDGEEHHPYWDTSWSNRQEIILTGNTSGAQTDYQLLLNVSYASGMQADFDDLRFTNDTHELDAWLESKVDGVYALVWVEFPSTPANTVERTYYMYYGNAGAASGWDGAGTFPELFDDFEDNDVSDWTIESGATFITVSDPVKMGDYAAKKTGTGSYEAYKTFSGINERVFEFYARVTQTSYSEYILIEKTGSDSVNSILLRISGGNIQYLSGSYHTLQTHNINQWYKFKITTHASSNTFDIDIDGVNKGNGLPANGDISTGLTAFSVWAATYATAHIDGVFMHKYATNPPNYAFGTEEYYTDSIHYNTTSPYNHTIDHNTNVAVNRTIIPSDSLNWTAAALTDDCHLVVTEHNLLNITIANFSVYTASLNWLQVTNLTPSIEYALQYANGTEINTSDADANGTINFTDNLTPGDYQIVVSDTSVSITLYSHSPCCIYTNYTGVITGSYIVESCFPLNYSTLAFLMGINHTPTADMHAYLKTPANDIADGIYRAHNRNNTPYLSWEGNDTITEGNVWKWAGGDNDSFWIAKSSINATHTWINITGIASNVFPSMFYIDRSAMHSAPKTGFEINQHQGIIIKTWDLEQLRGRSNDYFISMWFDTMLESTTPTENIEIWYCNDSFDPLTDDPTLVCDRKDSWTGARWMDHEAWQPHSNVSYCKPLVISADISSCSCPPTEINYIYIRSNTQTSKSYVLNATNYDPGITNITYAQTETMWLYDELSGVSTPLEYTPSFYMTFVRDYEEYLHHLYIANDQGVWGHSDIFNISIGIADVPPTHTIFNYFWHDNMTDYDMNGTYTESFWANVSYGVDPDNGAWLTHVLSLYSEGGTFVTTVNSSLVGNLTDEDLFVDIAGYNGKFKLQIISTDNEGSTATSWSHVFYLSKGTDEEIPLNLFIVLMVLMFGSLFYIYHAETYVAKIVTSLITTWMSFMLASMIVSGNVVLNYAELSTTDAFVYGSHSIQVASLSHFFMFTGVVSALFMLTFAIKLVIDTYLSMQGAEKAENEWDGVEEQ